MDKSIILQYKKAVEQNFRKIKMRDMIKGLPYKISEDQTDRNPLPFVTDYLRAEEALINEIELVEVNEREMDFLMKIINENEIPETSYPYLSFAANQIYLGMKELKEKLTGLQERKEEPDLFVSNPLDLIKDGIRNVVIAYENTLSDLVGKWKEDNKIKNKQLPVSCATFCIYLYEKTYFITNSLTTAKQFAFSRYGNDFSIRIDKLRKTKEVDGKTKYKKEKENLERLLYNIPYGKI